MFGGGLGAAGLRIDDAAGHILKARFGQQLLDDALGLVIIAFAEMMAADAALVHQ